MFLIYGITTSANVFILNFVKSNFTNFFNFFYWHYWALQGGNVALHALGLCPFSVRPTSDESKNLWRSVLQQ